MHCQCVDGYPAASKVTLTRPRVVTLQWNLRTERLIFGGTEEHEGILKNRSAHCNRVVIDPCNDCGSALLLEPTVVEREWSQNVEGLRPVVFNPPMPESANMVQPSRGLALGQPARLTVCPVTNDGCPTSRSFFARCGIPRLSTGYSPLNDGRIHFPLRGRGSWNPTSREVRARCGAPIICYGIGSENAG